MLSAGCGVWFSCVILFWFLAGFLSSSPISCLCQPQGYFCSLFQSNHFVSWFEPVILHKCTIELSWWNDGPPVLWLSPLDRNGSGSCYLIRINRAKPTFWYSVHSVCLSLFSCVWSELLRIVPGFAFAFTLKSLPSVCLCHIHLKDFIRGLFLTLFISFLLFLGSHFSLIDFSLCGNSIVMQSAFMPMIHF